MAGPCRIAITIGSGRPSAIDDLLKLSRVTKAPGFSVPCLVEGARLQYDDVRGEHMLLIPEGAVRLNETAAHVLELCDGRCSPDEIAAVLSTRYQGTDVADDVRELLDAMGERGLVIDASGR